MANAKTDRGVKIIRPFKRKPLDEITLEGALHKYNYTGIPGAFKKLYPRTDSRGVMRTGLDENAIKLQAISNETDRETERNRIKGLREYYEGLLGESLTPDSDFWKTAKGDPDDQTDAGGYTLEDKDNLFDMNNPLQAITFYWLMETGFIAPSITTIESGDSEPWVYYYVHDEDESTSVQFERKQRVNRVKVALDTMGDVRRKQIAKLLGLGVAETSSSQKVYVALDEYLSTPKYQLDSDPIDNFLRYIEMPEDLVSVKNLVHDLVKLNVVRVTGSIVKEGEYIWAKTIEDFEALLIDPVNSEVREAFEQKLRNKIKIDSI